jgi:carbon monoxide dehydrogenase subunit G
VRFEFEIEIDRPVAEVFAYLSDVRNLPEWQRATSEADWLGPEGAAKGARIRQKTSFLGRELNMELEVTAYEPDRRFDVSTVKGPISFEVRHSLRASDGGTAVHFVAEGRTGRLFRFAEPMIAGTAERDALADFQRLKAILESR